MAKQDLIEFDEGVREKTWYTIDELAELTGLSKDRLNHVLTDVDFGFAIKDNTKIVNIGGHRNVKQYSENILKTLKQYQLKNSAPNAVKNKETVIEGNISMIQHETVGATIDNLLDNPETLQLLLNKSLEKTHALGIENKQLKDIIRTQKPKAEWYDSVADSDNLVEIGTAGKVTGIGANKIFSVLVKDEVIYKKFDDGISYYASSCGYDMYFRSIPVPFQVGDKIKTRYKLMLTQKGMIWITKRYQKKLDKSESKNGTSYNIMT